MAKVVEPMYVPPGGNDLVWFAVFAVAGLLAVLGLALMNWITRDPDESPDHWRSHRH